jgi:hypothetical protein
MKKYYSDFYGANASTEELYTGRIRLKIYNAYGGVFYDKELSSERAAKQVMSRFSDGTMQEKIKEVIQ